MAPSYTALPKRTILTYKQRLQVCEHARQNPTLRHGQLADWAWLQFRLPKEPSVASIRKIIQNEAQWKQALEESAGDDSMRRKASVQSPQVEAMLLKWIAQQPQVGRIKGREIQAKAEEFAALVEGDTMTATGKQAKFSKGWLAGFEERYKINGKGVSSSGRRSSSSSDKRPSLSDPIPTRIVLTFKQRKELCEYAAANATLNRTQLAAWATEKFHLRKYISNHTVRKILERSDEWDKVPAKDAKSMRHYRAPVSPELDALLANWVIKRRERSIKVTGREITEKAKALAYELHIPEHEQPKFSKGWLASFMTRHKLSKPRVMKRSMVKKASTDSGSSHVNRPTQEKQSGTQHQNGQAAEAGEGDDDGEWEVEAEAEGQDEYYEEEEDGDEMEEDEEDQEEEEEAEEEAHAQPMRKKSRVSHLLNY